MVEYLAKAATHVLNEAAGWQQPVAGVTTSAAFLFISIVAINRHVYHSSLPFCHHLSKPQKLDVAGRQARRLHPELYIHLQVFHRVN
jgi:hypothetical protein